MKNIPPAIYLDIGIHPDPDSVDDFNDLAEVTWSADNATGHGIRYIRPTPPPDAVREAVGRLEHTYRSSPCAAFMVNGGDLRLILDHFKEQCDD